MKLYSTREAAEYLGLTVPGLRHYIYTVKNLVPLLIGNSLVFTQEQLDELQANRRHSGRPRKEAQ